MIARIHLPTITRRDGRGPTLTRVASPTVTTRLGQRRPTLDTDHDDDERDAASPNRQPRPS